jgi:hypothetical protein
MKKLMILTLVMLMASMATATISLEVDVADEKDSYVYSDVITINLVTDDDVVGVLIDAIKDDAGGTAQEPQVFNTAFGSTIPGTLNVNGLLVEYMSANVTSVPTVPATGVLYSFEYHVPDVPHSTIITIETYADGSNYFLPWIDFLDGSWAEGHLAPLEIHVTPEPMTVALLGLGGLFLRRRK